MGRSPSTRTRAHRLVGIAAAVALLVSSCGDDDDPESTSSADESTTTVADEGSTTTAAAGETTSTTKPTTTTEAGVTTTVPPPTASMAPERNEISGFVAEEGSESIDVTIQPGTTGVLTVTPDPEFDVVIRVTGPGQTGGDIDDGFGGEPEEVTLEAGEYVVVVSGYAGASGGYVAVLA